MISFGPLLLRHWATRQILAHGATAEARILDLTDTGNRFNEQPIIAIRLEVMPKDRPPYVAVVRRVVTIADADFISRGRVIMVKYDPANPRRVAIPLPQP